VFVLHIPTEYDYVFISERKTEFLTALCDEYKIETGGTLPLTFDNNLSYQLKGKKKQIIEFQDITGTEHTVAASKNGMVIGCPKFEVVLDVSKYTPAKMTKGADKPKTRASAHARHLSSACQRGGCSAARPSGGPQEQGRRHSEGACVG